jgi:hypothetical protein
MHVNTFVIYGPGCISGPWSSNDYERAHVFIEDMQEALGLPTHKLGDWLLDWSVA